MADRDLNPQLSNVTTATNRPSLTLRVFLSLTERIEREATAGRPAALSQAIACGIYESAIPRVEGGSDPSHVWTALTFQLAPRRLFEDGVGANDSLGQVESRGEANGV